MKKTYQSVHEEKQLAWLFNIGICMLALFFLCSQEAHAQLVGWKYRDGISVHENAGVQKLNYQVLLNINTVGPIGASKMNNKCNDIRFSKDCAGATLLNYYLDTNTVNSANTQIWVELDTLKANGNYLLYMWYGNSTAAAASNFNNTFPLSTQLVVPTGTVTLTGANNYSWFEVKAGASVVVGPNTAFSINARVIKVAGTINGDGAGYLGGTPGVSGNGPGSGKVATGNLGTYGAGGAGYGGSGGQGGGAGAGVGQPGNTYGTMSTDSIDMGSGGGGAASGGQGGNGGASITLIGDVIDIQGTVSANGSDGVQAVLNGAGGAGAGGGIRIKGNKVSITGIINAKGGNGQSGGYGSGGGGGGRVKFFSDATFTNSAMVSVAGGVAGAINSSSPETVPQASGSAGTSFAGTWQSKVPTFSLVPHVTLSSSTFPICAGSNATFTASTGASNYMFYVDTTLKQNTGSNTFSTNTLTNNSIVEVLVPDANGCADTSNAITVTVNPNPTITLSPASSICQGQSTVLTASGGTTYNWSPASSLSSSSGSSVTASPNATTTYTVLVTDNNSCQNSDTVTVTVNGCTNIRNDQTSLVVDLYPNPAQNTLRITTVINDLSEVRIVLCDMLGNIVSDDQQKISGIHKKDIDLSGLTEGIYFISVRCADRQVTKKFVKN